MEIIYFRMAERVIVAACVPILLYIGYRLFESGATGKMKLTAKAEGGLAKLTNLSPGALCFVLSVTLGGVIMFQEVRLAKPEDTNKPEDTKISEESKKPMDPIVFQGLGGSSRAAGSYERGGSEQRSERVVADRDNRLSEVIERAYSAIGLKVQDLVTRPNTTIQQVNEAIGATVRDSGLNRAATQSSLDQIRKLESGEIDDKEALLKWRAIFLGGGER